ncbi:conjugal transfer protein TrbB [Synergistales bacterium]|nr:conjugal transfer protein TrbB [Synergistales bacterium]
MDRLSSGMRFIDKDLSPAHLLDALGTLAALLETEITKQKPSLAGELPIDNGSRVQGIIPPVCSAPIIVIRKRVSSVIPLNSYLDKEKITQQQYDIILNALGARKNIVLSGGTGSGKTTFCNALLLKLAQLSPHERIVIMEDTSELQCKIKNTVKLHTVKDKDGTDLVTLNHLLRMTMRLSPSRIIIGEVRGGEALDLLKSWNTGHPGGFATVHANSALATLARLEQLILEAAPYPMKELIGEAVNIIIFLQRHAVTGPKVEQIIEVKGIKNGKYVWNEI